MDTVIPSIMGAEGLRRMHDIAQPMNAFQYQEAEYWTSVRVAGSFADPILGQLYRTLVAVDQGEITVMHEDRTDINVFTGFVEVIGVKGGDEVLYATAILPLCDDLDVSLWNEACLMMQYPDLRSLFTPTRIPTGSSDDDRSSTPENRGALCQTCGVSPGEPWLGGMECGSCYEEH
jgi:hypothetical protein